MARNKLEDLNNHLFAQIERLTDEDETFDKEQLKMEVGRSKALCELSEQIIDANRVALEAFVIANNVSGSFEMPNSLGIEKKSLGLE